jgi:YVTN family beta-propeller protein
MKSRHGSVLKIVVLCCVFASVGRSQYVEDSIDVGGAWVGSLAYNSQEDVLYGRCQQAGIFFAISCDSNKVTNSFELSYPRQMVYDSIDNKAYCAYEGAEEESLAVIDGRTHALIKSIRMPGATTPVWDMVSDRVYVSCQSTNKVAVVDCATDSLLKYVSVGACPMEMHINTLRRKLYVLNYDNGTVSIVNMITNQVVKTVAVGGTPNAGYYSPSADKFYSAGAYGYCTVIDGAADSIVARVQLPGTNADIQCATGNADDALVYLGTYHWPVSYVATVSASTDSLLDTICLGSAPYGLSYYVRSGLLYCAPAGDKQVAVLSGDGSRILELLQVGDGPFVFAQVPRHDRLYLGHLNSSLVYALRDTSAGTTETPQRHAEFCPPLRVTPNPFSRSVTVAWSFTAKDGDLVRVYAQDGRVVRWNRTSAGQGSWVWNGRDDTGKATAPGVYIVEAGTGNRQKVVKLRQ